MADEPKRAVGTPPERTDADLERIADVTEADLDAVRATWRDAVPEKWLGLFDAKRKDQ